MTPGPVTTPASGTATGSAAGAAGERVALCVVTYRRPVGLRATLDGIAALDVAGLGVDLSVVVVDNDAAGSAREVAEAAAATSPFPVTYAVEPRQGIPMARNRALDVAGPVDLVGWIDDDEVPRPDWLRALVQAARSTAADVVVGPSEPELPPGTPGWIEQAGFFDRTRFASGTAIPAHFARTSGVLVRASSMPDRPTPFQESLRFTGGSDREHFVTMESAGARFVWVDEAVVVERVPASRARASWILRRAFRTGNSRSTTLVLQHPSALRRARRVAAGLRKLATGLASAVSGLPRGRAAAMKGVWTAAYGAGLTAGALGYRYQEYRRHHGA